MRETKVNLKHLLEDIRDSYALPLEEVIVVELVANALDSGASRISFFIDEPNKSFTVVDNGQGMKRTVLADYHNIAATTKVRGRGIGFAGVGAKLSLLLAQKVITEAKGGYGSRCATVWHLKNETSAPWKFVPFSGKVSSPRGAAVSIVLANSNPLLLSEDFFIETIYRHFYSLFHPQLFKHILKHIYKKGVEFFVNDKRIAFAEDINFEPRVFQIKTGKGRHKQLAGVGYLTKIENDKNLPWEGGLAISTYGKVIKSGWEWLGLESSDRNIIGAVEIPALASILTTNKMDFLKDQASLKQYYNFRKAIQQAVLPVLEELGQEINSVSQQKSFRALSNEIERALRYILGDFPELVPLLGIRNLEKPGFGLDENNQPLIGMAVAGLKQEEESKQINQASAASGQTEDKKDALSSSSGKTKAKAKKGPALSIAFEQRKATDGLARMVENKIWINSSHPAYLKALQKKQESYHIVFSVALALSDYIEDNRSPQKFIDDFLACWGRGDKKTTRLLEV